MDIKNNIGKKGFKAGIVLIGVLLFSKTLAAYEDYDYILDEDKKRIPIPLTYKQDKTISFLNRELGNLSQPKDLFLRNGILYILDSGNNRIVKLGIDGNILGVVIPPEENQLKNPSGLFVLDDGAILIADTGNNRIVHLSPVGEFIEEFTKPDSVLYDQNYPFLPMKIYLDPVGQIFVINRGDYHGFVVLNVNNNFRGYLAPTKLDFSFQDLLIRSFASQKQKDKLARRLPPEHSNFVIHSNGLIYTTTTRDEKQQIKTLSTTGQNVLKRKDGFGEFLDENMIPVEPAFSDISVSENGIITTLDSTSCKIYQYDPDGILLTVFGGRGNWRGKFLSPVSVVEDENRNLYVLDDKLNNIQIFKPTMFMNKVHDALALFHDGNYEAALEPWKEIKKYGPGYTVAHKSIAKTYYKKGNWIESMEEYRLAEDKEGYSSAFKEYRHSIFRKYFGIIVLVIALLITGFLWSFKKLRLIGNNALKKTHTWKWEI